jgi:hypothetical protein
MATEAVFGTVSVQIRNDSDKGLEWVEWSKRVEGVSAAAGAGSETGL